MTVPDGSLVDDAPPCDPHPECRIRMCVAPFGPVVGGAQCASVWVSASGTFTYGPPPAAVASAYAAGDKRWWNYTEYITTDPAVSGCVEQCNFYQYINWTGPSTCVLRLGCASEGGPGAFCAVQDLPSHGTPGTIGTYSWTMTSSPNTFVPFFATSDGGGTCAAVLTP